MRAYDIPVTREREARDVKGFGDALAEIGFPMVIKACSPNASHKTERGLVHVDVRTRKEAMAAFRKITKEIKGDGASVLVQEMVAGERELVMGLTRDAQFGPCVVFGLGGIFAEVLHDVCFRVAPIEKSEALRMMREIKSHKILDAFRGMPRADLDGLAAMIMNLGRLGLEDERIKEIDINPVILSARGPIAVDALIVLHEGQGGPFRSL
jgi:acetyl-CoA synthetase (ADP-forming)